MRISTTGKVLMATNIRWVGQRIYGTATSGKGPQLAETSQEGWTTRILRLTPRK